MTPFGRSATPVLMMRPTLTPAIRRDGKRNSLAEVLSKRTSKSMTSLAPSAAIRNLSTSSAEDERANQKAQDSVGLSPRASSNSTRRMSAASTTPNKMKIADEQGGKQKPSDHKSHGTNETVLSEANSPSANAIAKIVPMNPIELPRPALTDDAVNTLERASSDNERGQATSELVVEDHRDQDADASSIAATISASRHLGSPSPSFGASRRKQTNSSIGSFARKLHADSRITLTSELLPDSRLTFTSDMSFDIEREMSVASAAGSVQSGVPGPWRFHHSSNNSVGARSPSAGLRAIPSETDLSMLNTTMSVKSENKQLNHFASDISMSRASEVVAPSQSRPTSPDAKKLSAVGGGSKVSFVGIPEDHPISKRQNREKKSSVRDDAVGGDVDAHVEGEEGERDNRMPRSGTNQSVVSMLAVINGGDGHRRGRSWSKDDNNSEAAVSGALASDKEKKIIGDFGEDDNYLSVENKSHKSLAVSSTAAVRDSADRQSLDE